MNKEILRKYVQIRTDVMYSPLMEDAETCESSPQTFSTPIRNPSFWRSSRRLFQSNRSFKINRKNSDLKPKKSRIRTFISEFHTKIQSWSEDLKNSLQRSPAECKTPNCVTPNRRIRRMLGRTPEKLYSPFSIETPPNLKWRQFHQSNEEPFANFYGWLTPPKRNYKSSKLRM